MKKYIYMIEVQKPTGAHQFIKVLDEILVVNREEVWDFAQDIWDDRIENYTYLGEVTKDNWEELLNYFYCLVRKYDESLEYTRDNYVYLIPKKGREPGIRIGHRLPQKLRYEKVKPIPFYPEKEKEETIDTSCGGMGEFEGLFNSKWYTIFYKNIAKLQGLYCNQHSQTYIYFEAFVLTYKQFYQYNKKDKYFYLLQMVDWPTALSTYRIDYVPDEEVYDTYIKPQMDMYEWNLIYGNFYANINKEQFTSLYLRFLKAAT